MNTKHHEFLQERLKEAFSQFRKEKVGAIAYNIMPTKGDIPLIKHFSYTKEDDCFVMLFEKPPVMIEHKEGDVVFLEDNNKKLVGIRILNIRRKGVSNIQLELTTTIDKVIKRAVISVSTLPEAAKQSIEKRKLGFFKEVISQKLEELTTT